MLYVDLSQSSTQQFKLSSILFLFQLTKTFSPEKTSEMQPGSVMAGTRSSTTQVRLALPF